MPVTQKDIALAAGVSQMTVSDVLQNRPRGRVKPETRQRILDAAFRLGYQPNIAARALRSRQSRIIAYVTSQDADRQYHALSEHLITGLARALCAEGYRLLIESAPSREEEPQVIQTLVNAGMCDGFVIRAFEAKDAAWEALAGISSPFVVIGQCTNGALSSLAHDPIGIVRAALQLFADRGHRAIGFAASPATDTYHRLLTEAWHAEAPAFGFDSRKWIAPCESRKDAELLAKRWRSMGEGPTAVLSYTDAVGFGFGTAWKESGISLADGHDLVTISESPHLRMTGTWYFDMDFGHLAVLTARELLRLLTGEVPEGPTRILPKLEQAL